LVSMAWCQTEILRDKSAVRKKKPATLKKDRNEEIDLGTVGPEKRGKNGQEGTTKVNPTKNPGSKKSLPKLREPRGRKR